jgi:hypothetical protein
MLLDAITNLFIGFGFNFIGLNNYYWKRIWTLFRLVINNAQKVFSNLFWCSMLSFIVF